MRDTPRTDRRMLLGVVAIVVTAAVALGLFALATDGDGDAERVGRATADPQATPRALTDPPSEPSRAERLTWAPPDTAGYEHVELPRQGSLRLDDDTDYVIEAPRMLTRPVELEGGRNIVWLGGHIRIQTQNDTPGPAERRGLIVSDGDNAVQGRIVHVEGLLIEGADLAEGINLDAPSAVVQIANSRIERVHFHNSDDRDGTGAYDRPNHPDIIQTWGGVRKLRIDGLTGSSAYQGLQIDGGRATGDVSLRRVNLTAYEHTGMDGVTYAGHRMISRGADVGTVAIDAGTVWVQHHPHSGWNAGHPNPSDETSFWRDRYRPLPGAEPVPEPPPGERRDAARYDAAFTDALTPSPAGTGRDERGSYARWNPDSGIAGLHGGVGRVYAGAPPAGDYVDREVVGIGYRSPGYAEDTGSP